MNNSMHAKYMRMAIDLALENVRSGKGGPFGAVIVKDGQVVATGVNRVTLINDPTAHAEVVAIRTACEKLGAFHLEGCTLYTSCEPCPMCLGALFWAHVKDVCFASDRHDAATAGFDDSFIYEQLALAHDKRAIPIHQVMRLEAQEVFDAWRTSLSKVSY